MAWLDEQLWQRLDALETRHQAIQRDHESAWRGLRIVLQDGLDYPDAWHRYCEVVAELDRAASEFEVLRVRGP